MKKLTRAAIVAGLVFTLLPVILLVHNATNRHYGISFFNEVKHQYSEDVPAMVKIDASPALVFQHLKPGGIVTAFVLLGFMWFFIWFVDTDRHLGKKKTNQPGGDRTALGIALVFGPLLLAIIFFFAGYSSKLASNSKTVMKTEFNKMIESGAIEMRGSSAIVDNTGVIADLFKGPLIN